MIDAYLYMSLTMLTSDQAGVALLFVALRLAASSQTTCFLVALHFLASEALASGFLFLHAFVLARTRSAFSSSQAFLFSRRVSAFAALYSRSLDSLLSLCFPADLIRMSLNFSGFASAQALDRAMTAALFATYFSLSHDLHALFKPSRFDLAAENSCLCFSSPQRQHAFRQVTLSR